MTADQRRVELIEAHRALVWRIATDLRRRFSLKIDFEELEAAGIEGLLQADEAFDPARGVVFATFAFYRVRGAILDNCRRLGLIRRSYRRQVVFEAAANELLEEAAHTTTAAATSAPALSIAIGAAIDELAVAFELSEAESTETPEAQASHRQLSGRLREGLDSLSEEERTVVKRYYFEGVRLGEVAQELGVSTSWVSRVHTRAIGRLRRLMSAHPPPQSASSGSSA